MINHIENLLYTGKTHTTGGRAGEAHSDDGRLNIQLSTPGSSGAGTNPEQLLAAGWSSCFIEAIGKAAVKLKIPRPTNVTVDAEVDLGMTGDAYLLQARLNVSIPGVDPEVARSLVDTAHSTCPYSKATRGNIDVEINVV
ncbi:organic hydroperoxide resistance protein [Pseudomonas sp. Irchel 3A7]|uniref:organic hydroperoxide resistance protein n=1 Tax=Pseudomonas sp. Irchel 3A7 TaxID=2008913 RepID=UPI000BA40933|nr:organic hydroperoxide resistance protein [Pseudomonas sp. Irchel 3A7]